MKTCCTHVLSWIRPPPEFNKRLRGAQTGKRKEKKGRGQQSVIGNRQPHFLRRTEQKNPKTQVVKNS